eukprot:TRINITY_DN5966_c0_g1_i1.p1 TRINITY_DN5966_c0_g1~~TRINITY_DN5966_c0_g1_i1.p1  ORF type:complete len:379 (+),score=90.61 TRINITY_DN5966_c0_g1_i1:169-1305(+)
MATANTPALSSSLSVKDKSKRRASAFHLNPSNAQFEFAEGYGESNGANDNSNPNHYNNQQYNNYDNAGHESGYGDWNNQQYYHQQPQYYQEQMQAQQQGYRFTNYQQQVDHGIQIDPNQFIGYDSQAHDAELIDERNREMRQIAADAQGLQETFAEVAMRMEEQREGLQQAEVQIQAGQKMTADAVYELVKAKKVQGKKNAFIGAAGGASAGAIAGGCAGIALGPVGAVALAGVGAVVGAAVGAAAGKGVAKLEETQVHKELFDYETGKRWVPDEEAPECFRCHKVFRKIGRRRHHCRKCGGVFCSKCTQQKAEIQLERIDYGKEVRVCVDCYYGRPPSERPTSTPTVKIYPPTTSAPPSVSPGFQNQNFSQMKHDSM